MRYGLLTKIIETITYKSIRQKEKVVGGKVKCSCCVISSVSFISSSLKFKHLALKLTKNNKVSQREKTLPLKSTHLLNNKTVWLMKLLRI